MLSHFPHMLRWSTVRWIEIFFILGLPFTLSAAIG
jgi:hypothetical protein